MHCSHTFPSGETVGIWLTWRASQSKVSREKAGGLQGSGGNEA